MAIRGGPSNITRWGIESGRIPTAVAASLEPIVRFFSYHDAHPIALSMTLMEKFGLDWYVWEPETLRHEILTTFRATSISEHNWSKIQAVRTLSNSTAPWEEWHVFEKVLHALNNNVPRFDVSQKLEVHQLMAGVDMVNSFRKEHFSDEIEGYIAACAIDEGITYLPDPLSFAQKTLSEPQYECNTCGNVDYDDLEDGRCDFCCGRFQDEHPLNQKPAKYADPNAGRDIRRFLKRDPGPAKDRYEEFMRNRSLELSEDVAEDVQAAKLVVAYEYMMLRRKQLVEQLEELKSWVSH